MNLYIGCPIWSNKDWVGSFYPKGAKPADFLRIYAQQLTAVEGNTTFYAVPSLASIQKWVEETPDTFSFCPKIPRAISHAGKLMDHMQEALQFLDVMRRLGSRLGPMFLQLPPGYSPAMMDDLRSFLDVWPAQAQLAVEVRHPAWFDAAHHAALQALLARHHVARVNIDTRPIRSLAGDKVLQSSVYERLLQARAQKPNTPIVTEPTAPFTFLRYIGHPQIELNAPYLDEWAAHLADWLHQGLDAYVFCHCPEESQDPRICRDLHERVAAKAPIPPLPQREMDARPLQARLF